MTGERSPEQKMADVLIGSIERELFRKYEALVLDYDLHSLDIEVVARLQVLEEVLEILSLHEDFRARLEAKK